MKLTSARGILVGSFILFLVVASGFIVYMFVNGDIYSDSMATVLTKLLTIYSVPLSVIIGGIFGQRKSSVESTPCSVFFGAFSLSILWNILVIWRLIALPFTPDDTIDAFVKSLETVVPASYFLVAGVLSYFFARQESPDTAAGSH